MSDGAFGGDSVAHHDYLVAPGLVRYVELSLDAELLLDLGDLLFLEEVIHHPEVEAVHAGGNEEHDEEEFGFREVGQRRE